MDIQGIDLTQFTELQLQQLHHRIHLELLQRRFGTEEPEQRFEGPPGPEQHFEGPPGTVFVKEGEKVSDALQRLQTQKEE